MKIKSAELEIVCGPTSKLPETELPEIAFAGRSNVGKSSLINCLLNRKSLARTSSQPGKTQTINFYNINEELYFVDLPGYGYAKTSKEAQAKWGELIERYLNTSESLMTIFLLVDIRHEAKDSDKMMYDWIIRSGHEAVVIATKSDKISRGAVQKQLALLRKGLGLRPGTKMIPFSAFNKSGREDILSFIDGKIYPDVEETE